MKRMRSIGISHCHRSHVCGLGETARGFHRQERSDGRSFAGINAFARRCVSSPEPQFGSDDGIAHHISGLRGSSVGITRTGIDLSGYCA
jgi:hypothetical protein